MKKLFGLLLALKELAFRRKSVLLISGFFRQKKGTTLHSNWGDDINVFFIEALTQKKVVFFPNSHLSRLFPITNYLCIGSIILKKYIHPKSIIWGSGIRDDVEFKKKKCPPPQKIFAVRGPLTRALLIERGIDCPEIYGDPALLLPRFYSPQKHPHKKIGLIPHHSSIENEDSLKKISALFKLIPEEDLRIIRLSGYSDWKTVIDEIYSCDLILSESLHGLIVAEAYKIPSIWINFFRKDDGFFFKYRDFYASIGKQTFSPVTIKTPITNEEIRQLATQWKESTFDPTPLLDVCPFEIQRDSRIE